MNKSLKLFVVLSCLMSTTFTYSVGIFSGGTGTVNDPYKIATLADLRYLSENSSYWASGKYFIQTADINAWDTYNWNVGNHDNNAGTPDVAMGFLPIGNSSTNFTGKYDGQNHTITSLYINRPFLDNIGLFGYVNSDSEIRNLGLINLSYVGFQYVGGLVGSGYSGSVSNTYTKGTLVVDSKGNSGAAFGGLVGMAFLNFTITDSYSQVNVNGTRNCAGGLVGINWGTITKCYATGSVSGEGSSRGGLVGENGGVSSGGVIRDSYATGNVYGSTTAGQYFGGLIGRNKDANIYNCYANGSVTGYDIVGGLIGQFLSPNHSVISNSYSIGTVSSITTNKGGLSGDNYSGNFTNCFWNTETSGIATSRGGTGKTTAEMKTQSTFTNWDFSTTPVWKINSNNNGYPYLTWQNYPVFSPTLQASALVFTSVTNYSMTIGWTNGNGEARAVFVKEGTGVISNPINQTTYTASSDWAAKGTQLAASGYYCVYNGKGNSVSITNFTKNTTYSVQIIEYNGVAGSEVYCTASGANNPLSQATANEGGTGLGSDNANCIILYPNPLTDAFRIQGLIGDCAITITDLSGRAVLQQQVSNNETVSVNTLPKGVYVLKIKNKNGVIERKFVKK